MGVSNTLGLQSYLRFGSVGLGARVPGGSSHTEPEEVRLEVHGLGVCGS